jgi:hypothetical protein
VSYLDGIRTSFSLVAWRKSASNTLTTKGKRRENIRETSPTVDLDTKTKKLYEKDK